jgi:hypothetical protein
MTIQTLTLTLALTFSSTLAHAQTVVAEVQLPEAYRNASVQVVEADGNPDTIELLAVRSDGLQSVGRLECAGPWINPAEVPDLYWSYAQVVLLHGRHYWLVRSFTSPRVILRRMDVPAACPVRQSTGV